MNASEVNILVSLIDSADGWIDMNDLGVRFRRRARRTDDSRSVSRDVETAVALLGQQGRVETARRGVRLLARKYKPKKGVK